MTILKQKVSRLKCKHTCIKRKFHKIRKKLNILVLVNISIPKFSEKSRCQLWGLFFDGFLLRLIFGVPLNYFVCRVSDGRASGVNIRNACEYMTARECGVMWGYSLVLMLKQHSRLPPRVPWLLICCCLHLIFTKCCAAQTQFQLASQIVKMTEEWLFLRVLRVMW